MGSAYAKGFLKAVMEYIQKHPEECNGINLAEYDFAPWELWIYSLLYIDSQGSFKIL